MLWWPDWPALGRVAPSRVIWAGLVPVALLHVRAVLGHHADPSGVPKVVDAFRVVSRATPKR
jgi:hypothetical protein